MLMGAGGPWADHSIAIHLVTAQQFGARSRGSSYDDRMAVAARAIGWAVAAPDRPARCTNGTNILEAEVRFLTAKLTAKRNKNGPSRGHWADDSELS
jgi:hypothetical protein